MTKNSATFDEKFCEKRLKAYYSGKFQIFKGNNNQKVVNYTNFMLVLQEEIKVCCGLRSGQEPRNLHRDSFEWITIETGHFEGTPAFKLKKNAPWAKGLCHYFEEPHQKRTFITHQSFTYHQDKCSLLSIHGVETSCINATTTFFP